MPLAVSMGLGHERLVNVLDEGAKINPKNVVIIGARSVDPGERQLIKEKGVKVLLCTKSITVTECQRSYSKHLSILLQEK